MSKSISCYLSTCDKELLDSYMEQISKQAAVVLKQQWGDQYGFEDDSDSPQHVTKNMRKAMLDNPAAIHAKSVENYFGNLDGRLAKSGVKGFEKSVDDLIIKYSQNLVKPGYYKWRDKHNKTVAKDLKVKAVLRYLI